MPPVPATSERGLAAQILMQVTKDAAYANLALRGTLARHPEYQPHQRAFITELVNGTLRNSICIDHILAAFTDTKKLKPAIRAILRSAVYQIGWLDKVPPSAAVNEAVNLTKAAGYKALAGFVNAVLRRVVQGLVQRANDTTPQRPVITGVTYPDPAQMPAAYLHTACSFPEPMAAALVDWLGPSRALVFGQNSLRPPAVTICINPLRTDRQALTTALATEGVKSVPALQTESLQLQHAHDLTQLAAYRQGWFHVQDDGALLAVKLLAPKPGQVIYDLCAAPGGKSFTCAYQMRDTGIIYAFDQHPHKIKLIETSAKRLGITCVKASACDATQLPPHFHHKADAVLLDAPCSGLGTLRKKPDIKFTKTEADIQALAETQRTLLRAAAMYVKPGGVIVYCTCTVTRAENMDNIRWFTAHYPFSIDAPPAHFAAAFPTCLIEADCLQILPDAQNDGFFMARLISQKSEA